jgi:RND superfamily putative drug exporter
MALPSGRAGKWITVAFWLVLAGVLFPLASKLTSATDNDASAWLPRSAEATAALNRAEGAFPGSDDLIAVVVYARDAGLTPADNAKITADTARFRQIAAGGQVSPPIPDGTNTAMLLSFPIDGDSSAQTDKVNLVSDQLKSGVPAGLQAKLTGPAGGVKDIVDAFSGIDSTLLFVTAGVVAVLLLITYRSPVLWLIPLINVGLASQAASAIVYLLAHAGVITVNGQSQGILTVLVFGAGTDYALLLIARYREELRRHEDRHAAMAVALRASLPAVLASGATVAISLLCLLAAQLNNVRGLGPVGAVGIACALLVMTTLLPAVLVICGRWLFWPFVPRFAPEAAAADIADEHGIWNRISGFIAARPRTIWLTTALVLGGLAFGMLGLHVGQTGADQYTKKVDSVAGQQIVSAHFPAGSSAPANIIARATGADAVTAAARSVPGIASLLPPKTSTDGQWVEIDAVMTAPPDTQAAKDTIKNLRKAVHRVPAADALVGGQTAIALDTQTAADHDNRLVIPLILVVVLVVLVVLLRAITAPLLLLASVVLSFATSMGTAALLFHALGHPNIDLGTPLLGFLFLVALGVDYTIFLMTRAREEAGKLGHAEGVRHALTVTGGVITSAGVVLAATFAVLAVLPLTALLQMGLLVSGGVLIDTLIIRTLLVPALSLDAGRRIWWPSRLASAARHQAPIVPPQAVPSAPERDHSTT